MAMYKSICQISHSYSHVYGTYDDITFFGHNEDASGVCRFSERRRAWDVDTLYCPITTNSNVEEGTVAINSRHRASYISQVRHLATR